MRVLILAAGQSQRFKELGFNIPKPFLPIGWRGHVATMLEHVINTVPEQYGDITIAISEDCVSRLRKLELMYSYVAVPKTNGPAHTALEAMRTFKEATSTMILDVDVLNTTNDLWLLGQITSPAVLVRESTNPLSSYVDKAGEFNEIAEKQRISKFAVQGAYYVPKAGFPQFLSRLEEAMQKTQEPYLSHALHLYQGKKFAVQVKYTPIEWGSPRDIRISGAHIMKEDHNARDRSKKRT